MISIPPESNQNTAAGKIADGGPVEIVSAGLVLHVQVPGDVELLTGSVIGSAIDLQVRQHGRVCVLFEIHERTGRRAVALWQDKQFDFKVRSFDHANLDDAKAWLEYQVESYCHDRSANKPR